VAGSRLTSARNSWPPLPEQIAGGSANPHFSSDGPFPGEPIVTDVSTEISTVGDPKG